MNREFLPFSKIDVEYRGWKELDIILVTGDAYVDHPSYGASIISRVLEDAGFRVGIIAQPNWRSLDDFRRLGRPRLFFGVTAGNLDSMVANYTANKKIRHEDDYSPGGKMGLRPDRAAIIYTNKIRQAFPKIPVIIGGMEASSRRLAHYDYWSDKVRRSILLDSKADILVYGMGERQILEIADRLKKGSNAKELADIKGTVIVTSNFDHSRNCVTVPSFEEVSSDSDKFNEAFKAVYLESDPFRGKTIVQKHADRFVIQYSPALPLAQSELDKIYNLNYARAWHPVYDNQGGLPGFEAVRFSIVSHRGCSGGCSFCALYLHQGRIIQSRSPESIINEAKKLTGLKNFRGTITDIGGPTANLYAAECNLWEDRGACRDKKCLIPKRCDNLKLGYGTMLKLWDEIAKIPKVKHVFIASGLRYDLLISSESEEYLKALCAHHVSGQLKVAPEHSENEVLRLMDKPSFNVYGEFAQKFDALNRHLHKRQFLVNYFISAHPGATLEDALKLSLNLKKRNVYPEQIQDFIPLPMTISGTMYYTNKDPFTGKDVYVAKGLRERKLQRALVQYRDPKNRKLVIEALQKLNRLDLRKAFHA